MKRIYCYICVLICVAVLASTNSFSQTGCPICTIDLTCDTTPTGPVMCPSSLPSDTAQQYYEANFTFYIPEQFDITDPISTTVTLNQVDVIGVSGLPPGLGWTAYDYTGTSTTSFYPPSNPPSSERGCATVCGTPLVPGIYTVTVSTIAYVNVPSIGNVTEPQSFDMILEIYPNPSGNSCFSFSPDMGCDNVTTTVSPILESNGDPLYQYYWDFGNGTTSTDEFPAPVSYTQVGDYSITCLTEEYEYVITDVNVNVVSDFWCGDVEEPFIFTCTGNPDMYFTVNDNASYTTSSMVDNTTAPSWSSLGRVIENNQFVIHFYDGDTGPPFGSPDDDLGSTIINVTNTGNYTIQTFDPNGDIGVNGTLTIGTQLRSTLSDTDTVRVLAVPIVNATTFSPNDSVCVGDSIELFTDGGYMGYQWYNDTNLLPGQTDSTMIAMGSGAYWPMVTNADGCQSSGSSQDITMVEFPPNPSFLFLDGVHLTTFITGVTLQWYLEGVPVPGETGTQIEILASGNYSLCAANDFGCETCTGQTYYEYNPIGVKQVMVIDQSLKVFPNPNNGLFQISFYTNDQIDGRVIITDISGRMVKEYKVSSSVGNYSGSFDVNDLSNGLYSLTLITSDGVKISRRITKM